MNRRLPHTRATVTTAGRGEDVTPTRPACDGHPRPFDVLHDQINGPTFHLAVKQAREMCGYGVTPEGVAFPRATGCPLRDACVATSDDQWARAVRGERSRGSDD